MRKLSGAISKSGTIAVFINQIREKVGVMFGNQLNKLLFSL
jgi:recombination protein RecA